MDNEFDEAPSEQTGLRAAQASAITMLAGLALLYRGQYRAAFLLYPNSGGGGLNLYKLQGDGRRLRFFAIDYHPFWDPAVKQSTWRLHYHRGDTAAEIRKHRPYEGGF